MMSRRVKERVCRSIEDKSDDDSMVDAKDEALTSLITHCEGKRYLFPPKKNRKGRPDRFSGDLPPDHPTDEDEAAIEQSAKDLNGCLTTLAEISSCNISMTMFGTLKLN